MVAFSLKEFMMQDHSNDDHNHNHNGDHDHDHAHAHNNGHAHDDSHTDGDSHAHSDSHAHHADHTGHEEMFRRRFWVSLVLSIPVLLYTPMLQEWFGFSMPTFPGSDWIAPVLSVIIFAYGGVPFLQMAVPELRKREPGMMMLISLAISVAFVYSLVTLFVDIGEGLFWELVTLIVIMLLGHWLEMRSIRQASGALDELAKLMPDEAERIGPDGRTETVPISDLKSDDLLLVRPGATIPADGEVTQGKSDVNEAMVTGESQPVKKEVGSRVIGGTVNEGDGSLRLRVTATGEETALAGIMRLVDEAQKSKSSTQILADKAAGWLFYIALAVAAVTAVVWTLITGFNADVVVRVVTVLVIACPHALGLAVPLVVAITTSLSANNGILIRDRLALETARQIDLVIFDKTGTLTKGEQGIVAIQTAEEMSENEVLALAAAVEGDSEHFIAQAMRAEAEERELSLPAINEFEALKGRGVKAVYEGSEVFVGGPRLLEMLEIEQPALSRSQGPATMTDFAEEQGEKGRSVIYLVQNGRISAAFALADVIRPESKEAVERLHQMGIEVAMLTGDSQAVANAVAAELGIDHVFAEVLPEHKDDKVIEFQKQNRKVIMVGDGVNDAPALTRADVGIAIGSGTDVAVESAGIILVQSNPLDVVRVVTLSRASYRKMVENLIWATGYNVVALPLAAGVLAPVGILLSPAAGAVLMSASTIIVAINAQLLRRAI
jgi:P-type Cu2+ transporter